MAQFNENDAVLLEKQVAEALGIYGHTSEHGVHFDKDGKVLPVWTESDEAAFDLMIAERCTPDRSSAKVSDQYVMAPGASIVNYVKDFADVKQCFRVTICQMVVAKRAKQNA